MPNTAPQKNAPNRNKAVAPNSTKSAPNQVQERSVKASSQKNAAKNLEHFNVDPPKMKTSGGQMSVARREQMIREIDIYVQMVYERLILEAQSNGGNAGGKHPLGSPFQFPEKLFDRRCPTDALTSKTDER